jgi:hypothetical protein
MSEATEATLARLPELETRCESCEGRGGHTERGKWYDCIYCRGAGALPTETGKQVLALVRHNLRSMESQIRED